MPPHLTEFQPQFDQLGWSPEFTTWPRYVAERYAELDAYLLAYRERIEGLAQEAGMVRVKPKAKSHFVWLAIFQTNDLRYDEMLTIAQRDQSSLTLSGLYQAHQALSSAAKIIEIDIRLSPYKGRKAGSRDKEKRDLVVRR